MFLLLLLAVLPVVLEFENGSREEELLLFSMLWRGDFRMVGVVCAMLRAVGLICWMPDWFGLFIVGGVSSSVLSVLCVTALLRFKENGLECLMLI